MLNESDKELSLGISEVIPFYWRGSEQSVFKFLNDFGPTQFKTFICLRRKPPIWWLQMKIKFQFTSTFLHYPIPPSVQSDCYEKFFDFFQVLPNLETPLIFFCKKGKNRTGIVSAILRYKSIKSIQEAINEYEKVAFDLKRELDVKILTMLLKNENSST